MRVTKLTVSVIYDNLSKSNNSDNSIAGFWAVILRELYTREIAR